MENREYQIHFRVTAEEKAALEKKVKERGVDRTTYILEKALQENTTCIYDAGFRRAVGQICSLMPYIGRMGLDKEIEEEYAKGVRGLWQYLK